MNQPIYGQNSGSTIVQMPELEQVYSVIKAMYEHEDFKESASKWLEELQRSVFAWKIADQILIRNIDHKSCYFAAQTLKTKILQSFNELPVESYDSLKNSIINHLNNMNENAIRTQLCLSLTYIFYMNDHWENPIEELSNKLPKIILLEILICIAQEYDENRPSYKLCKKRREQIELYLSSRFANIIHLLLTCYQESNGYDIQTQEQIIQKLLNCFEACLNFAKQEHLGLVESMLGIVLGFLKNSACSIGIHEKAADALCKVIYQCEAHSTFSDLRVHVIEQVFSLEEAYQNAIVMEDSSKLMDLTKIFVELGNSTIEFILYDQVDMKVLQLILNCTGYYELEVAEITFNFWYNFSDALRKHDYVKFAPYFNMLFASLTRLSQLDNDTEGIMDEKSDAYDYRVQISDLIVDISICIDWVNYIKATNVLDYFQPSYPWEIVEVHLYILYCMASEKDTFNMNQQKNDVLPTIINYILNTLPNQPNQVHVQLYATACDLMGELHQWINENSFFLQPIVLFLLNVIQSNHRTVTKLSTKAATALKQILSDLSNTVDFNWITKIFSELLNIYALIEDRVDLGVPLLACCTAILSNQNIEQCDQQEIFFQQLIILCMNKINVLNANSGLENDTKKWEKVINNIYAVFKNFRPNEKTQNSAVIHTYIKDNIWPFLKESISHFASNNSQAIEYCSRCVRHIVRSMRPSYLLQPIVDHIVPLYQQFPTFNSSLIYIGSVLVNEFANKDNPIISDGLIRMLNAFSSATFYFFHKSNLNNNPDILDDYFNLCYRVLTKLTDQFMANTETLNGILNLSLMAINVAQKEVNDSITKFLIEFINIDHPRKTQYISNDSDYGRNMFYSVIESLMLKLPGYFIPDMVEIIWMFKKKYPELYKVYLQYTTENLYQKAQKNGCNVNQDSFENFYETLISATNTKTFVVEFRYLQRLLN